MEKSQKNICLRKAEMIDIPVIVDYRLEFVKEAQGILSPEMEFQLRLVLKNYLLKSIPDQSFVSWIAEYENKPVGFSGMVIREQPANLEMPNGKTGYILNMFTIKEFRNKGICSLLFQKLIEEARELKLDKVELHATKDGEPIYRKFGFTEPHDVALEYKLS